MAGKEDPEAKLPTTWSWLLLLMLLGSFSNDNASPTLLDLVFTRAINSLTRLGLLPPNDISEVVVKSSKHSFKLGLQELIQTTFQDDFVPPELDLQFRRLVDHLKILVSQFKSPNKHLLIVDGLDDILTRREIQFLSLAALVYEANRLNIYFQNNSINAKIIILCRTDIYERLPGPNKNKIRQDSAHEIIWFTEAQNPLSDPPPIAVPVLTSLPQQV
jgi:hypothetical protein